MTIDRFPVAILAGGLATRLLPVTQSVPKALIDVAGEPFIIHQLRLLRHHGVTRVVVCVGHLGEMIQEVLEERRAAIGMDVQFSFDGPQLLGTAGALYKAAPLLGDAFMVLYGDSYLPCDFGDVQRAFVASNKDALMTVFRNDGQWDTSNVEFSGGRIIAYSKTRRTADMRHIDYGLGILRTEALRSVPAELPFDLAHLYEALLARGELAGYEVRERFYEIGSPEGLVETRALLVGHTA